MSIRRSFIDARPRRRGRTATAWLRFASILGPSIVGAIVGSGLGTVFLMFAAVAVVGAVVTALFAVETKGRVLEDVSP